MLKKKNLYIFFFIILYSCSANKKELIVDRMKNEVNYLSSDELMGRKTGTEHEKIAARYIANIFKKYDLSPKGDSGFFQNFNAKIRSNPHSDSISKKITGVNVIGYLNNNSKETIIIGAHYDHIGYGDFGSLHDGESEIHNGADDNASGVSIMINLVKELNKYDHYNYLFIAFSGEEYGLFGSSYYAKNPTIELENVKFMLNFDMVGRLNKENQLAINGVGTSTYWQALLDSSNSFDFDLKLSSSGSGGSDHTSFYLQNIPVLHFFTGQHEDYHKPSDDADKINFEGMYKILIYVKSIIINSQEITDFDFKETASDESRPPKFSVTLGVMPDYLFDGEGMRIDGVSKNKTASKYGIKKGDIVITMGEFEIVDMMSYMKALSRFNKGDSTRIGLNRDNKIIELDVVFQ